MRGDTAGDGTTAVAVLACLLVIVSGLALAPGTAAGEHITGEVSYSESNAELTVNVDVRNGSGNFTGGEEAVTVQVAGESVPVAPTTPEQDTYTYTIGQGELREIDALDGQDGSGRQVVVSHDGQESFNETETIRYVALDGSGEFTDDGGLRFGVGTNFGVSDGRDVQVEIDGQEATATYQRSDGGNVTNLVVSRDTLRNLGTFENPGQVNVSRGDSYVGGTAAFDVAAEGAALTSGERVSDGAVRFESPLFERNGTYAITVGTGEAQYLRTVEDANPPIEIDSRAVAAESSVSLTVERNGNTILDGQTVAFETRTVNGTADGATITFDSLPDRASGANVSGVWVEAQNGVERYEAGLNASSGTLTLSNTESLPRASANTNNSTDLLVQFEGATPLHATVALQSDGGGTTGGQDGNESQSGIAGLPIDPQTVLLVVAAVLLFVIGVILVYLILSKLGSDTTKLSLPFGSSESTGESPERATAEADIKVVDEIVGDTYPHAGRVVARQENRNQSTGAAASTKGLGPTGGAGPAGTPGQTSRSNQSVNTGNNSKPIDLTAGKGEAELEYGAWVFAVEEKGETIGSRTENIDHRFDGGQIALSVEPYDIDVEVTGGPNREPLAETVVEATADAGGWTQRKPADSNGNVGFKVPRSASAVSFTAKHETLPPAEAEYRIEEAEQDGVALRIADGSGAMTVETTVGDRPWPEVDVQITPVSADAKAYADEQTITTKSDGRRTVKGIPAGEYEMTAHPQPESVETTAAVERVTVEDGGTADVKLPIGISYTMSTAQGDRVGELEDRIEGLAAASNRDVAIPEYYGTVLTSMLELVAEVESAPERAVETGISPDETIDALLDATEAGIRAVDGAMSERRNVKLFDACEALPAATVDWSGTATLDAFLDGVVEGGDHERRALRDRLREVDEVLDQQWGEVNEIAPARKLHDRIGDLARETGDIDDELTVIAQTYVGVCLLDAVEGIFDHDALVDRLNSGGY